MQTPYNGRVAPRISELLHPGTWSPMFASVSIILLNAANILIADGLCDTVKQISGYLHGGSDVMLFYWFFESRKDPATSPTLIYFQGGPGTSSMYSLVSGNGGPCILNRKGDDTSLNKYSYNTFANILYIDQPASTGFSEGTIPDSSDDAARSTLRALEVFFLENPEYNTEVYYIGQSYAGHYIPPLAQHTVWSESPIKLKGVILGNSEVNPILQCSSMPTMAYSSGTAPSVLTPAEYHHMRDHLPTVISDARDCLKNKSVCREAMESYFEVLIDPLDDKRIDLNDLRLKCTQQYPECEYTKNFAIYFNSREVQDNLKVHKHWLLSNPEVFDAFVPDLPVDYSPDLGKLLDKGLRVMIYAGDQDYMCNWIGNRDMALKIQWAGQDGFSKAPEISYFVRGGQQIGKLKSFTFGTTGGHLSFAQIFKAGHDAAKDSPEGVLQLVSDFVFGHLN